MSNSRYRIFKVFENELGSAPVAHIGVWDFYFALFYWTSVEDIVLKIREGKQVEHPRHFRDLMIQQCARFADEMIKVRGEKVTAWVEDQDRRVREEKDAAKCSETEG